MTLAVGRKIPLAHNRQEYSVATTRVKKEEEGGAKRRRDALRMVDRHLSKGNSKVAFSLVKQLQRQPSPSALSGFGAARQVPRRVSSVEDLNLSVTQTFALQSLLDAILDSIEKSCVTGEDDDLYLDDDVVENNQVVQHESGHFLVGYLLGVLPKQYKFSRTEDKIADANVKFVGFEFLTELEDAVISVKNLHTVKPGHRANKLKVSSTVLSKFACVIVGGLVAEHLAFGHSKGHHGDLEKLYRVLNGLQFTEDEANNLTRWAVLNTLTILNRHGEARSALAEAMTHGRSIGNCIHSIESSLNHLDM